jgi:TDG/mug DNA glycosylase family protein
MARRIQLDGYETLQDILAEDLDVLFVGYNPNPYAVEHEHYYHRKANRFWEDLREAGFVPRIYRGRHEDLLILKHRLGLTDVIKRPTPNIDGLGPAEFKAGFERLAGVLEQVRPRVVCFNGLGLLERFRKYGRAPEGTEVRAVPSTSPRNNNLRAARLQAFKDLRAWVEANGTDRR